MARIRIRQPIYTRNSYHDLDEDIADILAENNIPASDPMCMDMLKWNYDHEDMTDESYQWREMLSLEMLRIVSEWDREWCKALQRLFLAMANRKGVN